ncbi:MAG: Fis family transcriptional regulator [Acidobacteria bacterium]|nr:Fis family transcriptional regulator [Acidobacteriota bacterium]
MAAEIFNDKWAKAWGKKINENGAYKKAAANWEGAMVLVMSADKDFGIAEERAVIADLWHGDCRGAHAADEEDLAGAPYVIRANPATWKEVLAGRVDPIFGLLRGKLKLSKGSVFSLVPYAVAAKELVTSARNVDTTFPKGWD